MLNELQKQAPNQCSNDLLHYSGACTELRLTIRNVLCFALGKGAMS